MMPAHAQYIYTEQGTISINGAEGIFYIDGFIGIETWEHFEKNVNGAKLVILNSLGGYFVPAKKIAALIRKKRINTIVRNKNICYSACVLLFQAGKKRIAHVNTRFMIHIVQIEINNERYDEPVGTIMYKLLLRLYGFNEELINKINKETGDFYFDAVTAKEYGVVTDLITD